MHTAGQPLGQVVIGQFQPAVFGVNEGQGEQGGEGGCPRGGSVRAGRPGGWSTGAQDEARPGGG